MKQLFTLVIFLTTALAFAQTEEARLLRFPATNGTDLTFTYAGDLYTVPLSGGMARKLTDHDGYEMFARYSPDGKQLAFTGQYDGNTEVFLIPSAGGEPKRLTVTATLGRDDVADRMGPNNLVMGWTPDGNQVLFRSRMKEFNSFIGQLFLANLDGSLQQQVPLPRGGFASYSPDGKKLAYNRVFREFRTWKRYRGGMADDVWIYDFETKNLVNVTENGAQDIIPMWHGNKIFFLSDRDENKRFNLYVYDLNNKKTTKLTNYTDFDIKFPSLGGDYIVYEYGGSIYSYNILTGNEQKVTVMLAQDFTVSRNSLKDVSKEVSNYEISPDGNRALFGARGDVFTVPAKDGITRNLTQTSGVHDRNSKWSPDGQWIAYISDRTGEDEIFIQKSDGSEPAAQLTSNSSNYKYQVVWSPDSKKLMWADRNQSLHFVDITSKRVVTIDKSDSWEINAYTWSPDSRYVAYVKPEDDFMSRIFIYTLANGQKNPVTDGWFGSDSPSFSPDGHFLYFVSNRDFNPTYSWTEWNHSYGDMAKIYMVTLAKATKSPFELKNDEVSVNGSEEKKSEEKAKETVTVNIDFDGILDRVVALPIKPSNYFNLTAIKDRIYYLRRGSKDSKTVMLMYDLDKKKENEIGDIAGYEISANGKKMLVGLSGQYAIIDCPSAKADIKDFLDLSGMKIMVDYKQEWNQIFNESWRQMRDFLYAPNMHGVDWQGIRNKYAPLVKYVNHRNDLTYVIGEMIGELNVGHAYVGGGDRPSPERIKTGLLGAQITRHESGYYQVSKVLKGANWSNSLRSPLTELGVNVKEGDFILAVDGKSTRDMTNFFNSLIGKADETVMLSVNNQPTNVGARNVLVKPIDDEHDLYYYNWVQANIEKVNTATDGKVGYIHIPDMGVPGLNEFIKYYYPQLTKKGLIVDVRGNGGGNVSPMIIERLQREITMIDAARNATPGVNPGGLHWGPKVALCDEFSASDGDLFTYRFKKHKLGPVIGKRTWGGTVGIRGSLPFIDGGSLNKPEFSRYNVEGDEWIIEGYGVDPDIVVDNDPAREFAGDDDQLNKAVDVILDLLKKEEKTIPQKPDYPVR